MAVTIEEVKSFYAAARRAREDWLTVADASWLEIKRRQPNGALLSLNNSRKKGTYPAWWSISKIRQPLYFSRLGVPIGRDTSESGNDSIGATAALLYERLVKNLAKSFDLKSVIFSSRDDFIATDFGLARAYYERDEVKERVKEYLTVSQDAEGNPQALDSAGNVVTDDDVYQDDDGTYIYTSQVVDVTNERICLEPVLYKHVYVDPGITRWSRCKRLAFDVFFSVPEFKEMFGVKAYVDLMLAEKTARNDDSASKEQTIKVIEYWDHYEKKVYWFCEQSKEFLNPQPKYKKGEDETEDYLETRNGLYDLERFWPCTTPLLRNAPTDDFWPVPEYYQISDVLRDIHNLFTRMMAVTRAIRARLLFDDSIEGLEAALSEARDADAIGIPNLSQALTRSGGQLNNAVQYLDLSVLIASFDQLARSLEQRLNVLYKLTGTSDLLQGLITDPTQRTFGERQMTEKYALNQIEEPQVKMAEFNRDCYQLIGEMALKNFKQESLDIYMMPSTLPPEHQQNYAAAVGMLKQESKRFRIELETDSTIAINEQYDKQMRTELVNVMTDSLAKTAQIAESQPALVELSLHAMKFLIQGFRGSKLFQGEITTAIDNILKGAQEAAQNAEPPFDKDQAELQFKNQELQITAQQALQKLDAETQLKVAQIQSTERIESAKMQQEAALESYRLQQQAQLAAVENQLATFKLEVERGKNMAEMQLKYEQIKSQIGTDLQELALKRDQLMADLQIASGKLGLDQFKTDLDVQVSGFETALKKQQVELEHQRVMLDEREKWITEMRLQDEHRLNLVSQSIDQAVKLHDAKLSALELKQQLSQPKVETEPKSAPKKRRKRLKVEKDEQGNIIGMEAEDISE